MIYRKTPLKALWTLASLTIVLAACGGNRQSPAGSSPSLSVPTIAPAFSGAAELPPTAQAIPTALPTTPAVAIATPAEAAVAQPTTAPAPTAPPRSILAMPPVTAAIQVGPTISDTLEVTSFPLPDLSVAYGSPIRQVPVLTTGQLDSRWTLEHTWGMTYEVTTQGYSRTGAPVMKIQPYAEDYGRFFLAVRPKSGAQYDYDRYAGISFWISGGDTTLYNDEIAVTIVGSNFVPYYRWDDRSVLPVPGMEPDFPTFSETLLVFLGVDEIPPNTWLEVVLWIDERDFDPVYKYITGIYVRSTETVPVFYLDGLSLLEIGE